MPDPVLQSELDHPGTDVVLRPTPVREARDGRKILMEMDRFLPPQSQVQYRSASGRCPIKADRSP